MARRKKTEPFALMLKPENVSKEACAFSRDFAYMQLQNNEMVKWSKTQKQLFLLVLEQIDWTKRGNANLIELDNREIAFKMGWSYSKENERKIAQVLTQEISQMWEHSKIELKDPISKTWFKDHVIATAGGNSLKTYVSISPFFMNHFEGMYQITSETGVSFPVLMSTDVLSFKSSLTYDFYLKLRVEGAVGGAINKKEFSTFKLKELLHLDKSAYTKKIIDAKTGEEKIKFDRTNFEKYALTVVLEDINKSETIQIIPFEDGKLFKKIKVNGKVDNYLIKYRIFDIKEIRKHREQLLMTALTAENGAEDIRNLNETELNQIIKKELAYVDAIDVEGEVK